MKNIVFILVSVWISLFITACGGSNEQTPISKGDESPLDKDKPNTAKNTIVGYVIDSPIWGLNYTCGNRTGETDKNGKFECPSLPITFHIGSISIGSVSKLPTDKKVFPQDIVGVLRGEVENENVLKLSQFFQSLDDDGDIDNEIKINDTLKEKLHFDEKISLLDTDKDIVATLLQQKADIQFVNDEVALKHLKSNITKGKKPYTIELSLAVADIPMGLTGDIATNGVYKIDNKDIKSIIAQGITYTSSDKAMATIDTDGKITALKEGTVTITANFQGLTATSDVRISPTTLIKIKIVPPTLAQLSTISNGGSINLRVDGYYSTNNIIRDVSPQVIWNSKSLLLSNIETTGAISSRGKEGNASISAQLNELNDKIEFEIKDYPYKEYKLGHIYRNPYGMTPHDVNFTNEIKIPKGATISLRSQYGGSSSYGYNTLITLYGFYQDDSNQPLAAEWDIDNKNIFEFGQYKGTFTAKELGSTTLTAKFKDINPTIKLTVIDPIIMDISASDTNKPYSVMLDSPYSGMLVGETIDLNLTVQKIYSDGESKDITDSISLKNLTLELITLNNHTLTAIKEGSAQIEVSYTEGNQAYKTTLGYVIGQITHISIDGGYTSVGSSTQISAYGGFAYPNGSSYGDISRFLTWKSLDESVATITKDGKLTGIKRGSVDITATSKDGKISKTQTITIH